jgi:hypothetical protein
MIYIKDGVQPRGLVSMWAAISNVSFDMGLDVTITACIDGKHSKNSRHYYLAALDLRSKDMPEPVKAQFRSRLAAELGSEYDVLLEGAGTPNEHFHLEFDP